MKRKIHLTIGLVLILSEIIFSQIVSQKIKFDPEQHKIISSDRPDGRYVSTRGFIQHMVRNFKPQLAFNPQFTPEEFRGWQDQLRIKMLEIMQFPVVLPQPQPKLISKSKRDGYTLEKWECYPQPGSVVPFLMLVPDGVSAKNPAPAVLCFSGSMGTKETLAGEENLVPVYKPRNHEKNMMALNYVKQGIVAVAMDHPGIGESSDLERYRSTLSGYDIAWGILSQYLMEMGWSYLGLSSFQGQHVLTWMKSRDFIDSENIALSGHSLGTEPAMVLAVLNPDVRALVFNDFMCRLITRAKVLTKPTGDAFRTGSAGHFPPNTWKWFDHPDIVASLAPRPVILTEGGAVKDLDLIKKAYEIMGAKNNIAVYHYAKYSDSMSRLCDNVEIPEGLNMDEYFQYANVDAPNHYFKSEFAVPWLSRMLKNKP